MNASRFVTAAEKQQIEAAIDAIEQETSAEVVCAVATESGRYDRAEAIAGLIGSILVLLLVETAHRAFAGPSGAWEPANPLHIGWQALAITAGFVVGNVVASHLHPVRRLLVTEKEMQEETARAAAVVFQTSQLASAQSRSAVLIFVSLFERRLVVLPDIAASKQLDDGFAAKVRDATLPRLAAGQHADAMLAGLAAAAPDLKERLPAHAPAAAEVSNALLVFHPRP